MICPAARLRIWTQSVTNRQLRTAPAAKGVENDN